MAPSADLSSPTLGLTLPEPAKAKLIRGGVDPEHYPTRPEAPQYLDEVYKIRGEHWEHNDPGLRADPEKKALFGAATKVTHVARHIGTELEGIQLSQLTDQQKDELALLIAERSVVFLRDQQITPKEQLELGKYFGKIEIHPQVPQVPGLPGVTVMWPDLAIKEGRKANFRQPGGASGWHTDLVHELQPAGVTHLHNDTVPEYGGDTLWTSGYSAYDKLSPEFRKMIDGKSAIFRSAHPYLDRNDPKAGPKYVERVHPIVRVHPVTGWKSLFVNRAMTVRILGLDKPESDLILGYLYDVLERNVDIQARFKWTPGASALWDNRITCHIASWDYEGSEPRHGTRVTTLAEKPIFNPDAPSRRQALGLDTPAEGQGGAGSYHTDVEVRGKS